MTDDDLLVPARIVNEWVYCPRLAWLEWVDGEWADSADTVDGRRIHRRVDRPSGDLPEPEEMPAEGQVLARSLLLSAPDERLIARLDLVESTGSGVRPVDYKRGRVPEVTERSHLPERAQLAAQALVLRAAGHVCEEGVLYFAGSKERVVVLITEPLLDLVRRSVTELLEARRGGARPRPLEDSPKCVGCSLAPICLPDEVGLLGLTPATVEGRAAPEDGLRRLVPARDDAIPLHVGRQGAYIAKRGEELEIRADGALLARAKLPSTSVVALYGNVHITTPVVRDLLSRGIPLAYHSMGGWYYGHTDAFPRHALDMRRAQYRTADEPARRLEIARRMVTAKLQNQRTLLRRNADPAPDDALRALRTAIDHAGRAADLDHLRGAEGEGAAAYFRCFSAMLRPPARDGDALGTFDFAHRSRRPPSDPVNAMLGFGYAVLVRECATALTTVGLDPMLGFLHEPRPGRPALALDLMEEFRPILTDSVVLTLVNTGEIDAADFVSHGPACNLTESGRRVFLRAWERRLDTLVTHPVFGYRISYRRTLEVQARLLGRHLLGELSELPAFLVR